MTKNEALAFLCKEGNFAVPCSRYGRNSEDCAPVAFALAEITQEANGDEITEEALDYYMGLVVNDHDDVLSLIKEHGTPEHRALLDEELLADEFTNLRKLVRAAQQAALGDSNDREIDLLRAALDEALSLLGLGDI